MIIGVIVGRFQVESLHEGHRFLIGEAMRNHRRVIIFVGCAPIRGTKHDPMDFDTRERMLRAEYPDAIILPQYDHASDEVWSTTLDSQIRGMVPNLDGAKIYGGRDSFKAHYTGEFTPMDVDSGIEFRSGSAQRSDIGKVVRGSADFRAGIIHSTQNSWPYVKMCVDVACIKQSETGFEIVLGKKDIETKWRLPGGMVDKGESLEKAARRELHEETDIVDEHKTLTYIGSYIVNDWRFKNAGEIGLLTGLFIVDFTWGSLKAKDDLKKLKWCPISKAEKEVVKAHKPLILAVLEYLK